MAPPPSSTSRVASLPTKVALVVLLAVAARAALLAWTSLDLASSSFREVVGHTFPTQVERTVHRVDAWLEAGHGQVKILAADPRVLRAASGAHAAAARRAFENALAGSPILDSLWLVDDHGQVRVADGQREPPKTLPDALRQAGLHSQIAEESEPIVYAVEAVRGRDARSGGWLVASYAPAGLRSLLAGDSLPGVGRGYLVGGDGQVLFAGAGDHPAQVPLEHLRSEPGHPSAPYTSDAGDSRIGTAQPLSHLGWHVALEAQLDQGFDPVKGLLWQIFAFDVALILCVVWLSYRIVRGLVRPVEALRDSAQRIAQGDLDVDVPVPSNDDEIGTLTGAFHEMAQKLRDDQAEIEAAHRQLREQNQALQAANEVLAQLSITDGLTKLHNHRFFQDHLTRELKRAKRSGEDLSLLLIDIDDFKALNDQFGHAVGDAVLERIGQVMNTAIRESDLLARYGGEEFVVLAATDLEGAVRLAEKLRLAIEQAAIALDDTPEVVMVTVSVGVSRYKGDRKAFFRDADRALYAAKASGKNCVVVDAEVC